MAHSHYKLLLCILSIISAAQTTYSVKNRTINILCLLPYIEPPFNPSLSDGPQMRLALELAKEEINNQTEILPDYQIELIHDNGGCQHMNRARESLVRNVYSFDTAQRVVGIIGPGCSGASIAVSALTSRNELSLVTLHGGASFLLENRLTYQYALGSLGSAETIVTLAKQLIKRNEWERVSVLFEETRPFYSVLARRLAADLNTNSTTQRIISQAVYNTSIPLDSIVQQGLRINFLFTARELTRNILCLAIHRGMVYEAYQWIVTIQTIDEVAVDWTLEYNSKSYNCSKSDFKEIALNGSLLFNFQLLASEDSALVRYSKYSSSQYDDIIHQEFKRNNLSSSIWTTYFYDSLWAWAVVLHRITSNNSTPDLTTYQYGNTAMADSILEEFYQLNFQGVSGKMRYLRESGFLDRIFSVLQVTNGSAETVGRLLNESELELYDSFVAINDSFLDEVIQVDTPTVSIFMVITFLQLVIVGALHILTIIYRKYPSVKASSVTLNQLIFSGCYLMGVGTLFLIIGSSNNVATDRVAIEVLCNLSVLWLLPISFTLTFGTVAVKTFRLYRIFVHYLKPGRFISDTYLALVVCVLLLVDVISSTILTSTNPQRLISMNFSVTMRVASFQKRFQYCSSNQPGATIGVIYGYRFVLIVVVLILAILTRKIRDRSFSTITLQILVYFSTPVFLIGLALFYIFQISMPESLATFFIPVVMYNLVLLLLIVLVCLPPLLPKLREKLLLKKPNSINHNNSTSRMVLTTIHVAVPAALLN